MSEPTRDGVELPALDVTDEDVEVAYERSDTSQYLNLSKEGILQEVTCRERQLKASIADLKKAEAEKQAAIAEASRMAIACGRAEEKLQASELVGVVEGWIERCKKAEAANRELQTMLGVRTIEIKNAEEENALLLAANREKDAEIERLKSQLAATDHVLKHDCSRALVALAGAHVGTPAETYGVNTSWAISDLCRTVTKQAEELTSLRTSAGEKDSEIEKLKAEVEHHMDIIVEFQNRDASGGEKWIEIKEGCEMPEDDERVFAHHQSGRIYAYTYSPESSPKYPFRDNFGSGDGPSVTHWMPLPAPPLTREKE